MGKLQKYLRKCAVPVPKSKREILSDIYSSSIGTVVGILAIQKGGGMAILGILIITMVVSLFFIPET